VLNTFDTALKGLDKKGQSEFGNCWADLVKNQMVALEESYRILLQDGRMPIDYSDLSTQAAYLYGYGMPRAYFADEFLRRHRRALNRPLFSEAEIAVVSFGGGPASELVGLVNYLDSDENGEPVKSVSYHVYDKDGDWKSVAKKVVKNLESNIEVKISYHQLDLADVAPCAKVDVGDANLVFFSYIMSELCALATKDAISQNVNRILGTMRSGTAIMLIESKQTEFIKYFKECKGFNGKERNDDAGAVDIDFPPFPPTFERYGKLLDRQPRGSSDKIVSKWYVKT
jgi:Putative SAM-dependent methyltransferase